MAIETYTQIAERLNQEITTTGKKLQKDNTEIWGSWLHQFDNQTWLDLINIMKSVEMSQPGTLTPWHKSAIEEATAILKTATEDRILDRKRGPKGKGLAWKLLMAIRESYNTINDIYLPNQDQPKRQQQRKCDIEQTEEYTRITIWHSMFEIND